MDARQFNDATVIHFGGADTRHRSHRVYAGDVDESMRDFHPLLTSKRPPLNSVFMSLLRSSRGRTLTVYAIVNLLATVLLFTWCHASNSMAMTALAFMTVFDFLYLLTSALSLWTYNQKYSARYSFGYERFEVLAVFASTMLAQLGSFFIFKESVERMVEAGEVHCGRLPLGAAVAFAVHTLIIYGTENLPFRHVIHASSSSWLQEHVTDISESLCHLIPGLSKLLLPRVNPFMLLGVASSLMVIATYLAIDLKSYMGADTVAAFCIGLFTIGTMFPMSSYTGKILLQTTPAEMIGQLDKCLREACTLDGVLEFRNEHFWTLAFGKMAGSVHLRVRRDANDQLVLAHVYTRLSSLVHHLTIQIFKDDWSRATAYQIINNTSLPPITPVKSARPYSSALLPETSFVAPLKSEGVP